MNKIYFGDNLPILREMRKESIDLIYIDPPFNTGKRQERTRIKTVHDPEDGDRVGFGGKTYRTKQVSTSGFDDEFEDYISFLEPRLNEAYRLLKSNGSLFFHIDYREVHYCKILLDQIFGRDSFINEIIWAYDFGGRSKSRWSAKHDNILWYAKDPNDYTFRYKDMDRIPYMAPGLVGKKKAARGKTPTDVWWHTIVHTNGEEKTGYPTQKPLGIVERIVNVHSSPGDILLDFFAGSGTFGESAAKNGRSFVLIDNSDEAIRVMYRRLKKYDPCLIGCDGLNLENKTGVPSQKLLFDTSNI
jgi:site-specific DNA-methyltransferase (adenine-specific)